MSAENQPFLDVSAALRDVVWMQRLTLTGNPAALEGMADRLNVDLHDESRLLLVYPGERPHYAGHSSSLNVPQPQDYVPTVHHAGDLVVEWAPQRHHRLPEHQAALNMAVADRLIDQEHAKQRQLAAIWGGAIAVAGAIVGGAGEIVAENNIMTLTGAGLFLAGLGYIVHKQKRPKTPDVRDADPPVRVERDIRSEYSGPDYY